LHKIIAFANQKGGVGKTTSCVNLAAAFYIAKQQVLLIDLDPQGNATMGSGVNKNNLTASVNDALLEEVNIADIIVRHTAGGYDLLPANADLTAAEVSLMKIKQRERKLKEILQPVLEKYDLILLDCPPSLNMLTLNALVAANAVIVPMQCEYYALEGLSALLSTLRQVKSNLNPSLYLEGIIQTMYDPRNRLSQDVEAQLKGHFGNKVYKTVIPRNVRLAEAPSHGMPVLLYDKGSKGAAAYLALAGEILEKLTTTACTTKAQHLETA